MTIGEVFRMHHQLGGSAEDDMNKMSVIGHFFQYFIVAILGVPCLLSHVHLRLRLAFFMWTFALDLSGSGNCPGGAKSRLTASESLHSTPIHYPPSNYKFIGWGD